MVELMTRMILMGSDGDSLEDDTFYGDFVVKLVWRLSGVLWRKHGKSDCHTISILIFP